MSKMLPFLIAVIFDIVVRSSENQCCNPLLDLLRSFILFTPFRPYLIIYSITLTAKNIAQPLLE